MSYEKYNQFVETVKKYFKMWGTIKKELVTISTKKFEIVEMI